MAKLCNQNLHLSIPKRANFCGIMQPMVINARQGDERAAVSRRLNDALSDLNLPMRGRPQWLVARLKERGVKISRETARKWLEGESMPFEKRWTTLAEVVNLPVAYLRDGVGEANMAGYVKLQRLDVKGSAGYGAELNDFPEVIGELSVLESWARRTFGAINHQNVKIISCRGDSMAPTIQNGDTIFVDTSAATFIGDAIYVFIYQGRLLIKRLRHAPGGGLAIHSDNRAAYEVEYVPASEVDQVHICGQVVVWWTTRSY